MTRRSTWKRHLWLAVALTVALVGCNRGEPGLSDPRVGMEAQDFVISALQAEGPQRLSDHQGEVILMDFWGTSCPPCRRSMPEIEALHEELGDAFTLLSINVDGYDDRTPITHFLEESGIEHDVLIDNGRASVAYSVNRIPLIVIIDRDWRIARVFQGYTEPSILRQALNQVIGEGESE